jgi:hypothetical protein
MVELAALYFAVAVGAGLVLGLEPAGRGYPGIGSCRYNPARWA